MAENFSILIAPDKFKGTLTGIEVAEVIGNVFMHEFPNSKLVLKPIADGGDGSVDTLCEQGFIRKKLHSYNALMEPSEISYAEGYIDGKKTAFLEMASICGIAEIIDRPMQPYFASSYGLGETAYQILDSDIQKIIVSVGGSASIDGGLGFLTGIGAIALDSKGSRVSPNLYGLSRVDNVNLSLVHPRVNQVEWTFLVDVNNPLIGSNGAAHVYGPQKGLPIEELDQVDETLAKWAKTLYRITGKDVARIPGAGAAGGVPAIALSIFSAKFATGAEWFYEFLNMDVEIQRASLVITGEGSFDSQTLMGKGPGLMLQKARERGKKVAVVAGRLEPDLKALEGVSKASLAYEAGNSELARAEPRRWLEVASKRLASELRKNIKYP